MPKLKLEKTPILMPFIKLKIKGIDRYFMVDTGAEASVFDPEIIDDIESKLDNCRWLTSQGMGGSGRHEPEIDMRFNFCGVSVSTMALTKQLRVLANEKMEGLAIAGLIGQDILQQFAKVIIDNEDQTIEFVPKKEIVINAAQ